MLGKTKRNVRRLLSRTHIPLFLHSYRIDQCAEWVEAVAHEPRVLSGFPLSLPLDRPGIFLWREDAVRAPRDSGKIAIFRVVVDFQVKAGAIGEQRLQLPDFTQSHRAFLRRGESPFVPEEVKI